MVGCSDFALRCDREDAVFGVVFIGLAGKNGTRIEEELLANPCRGLNMRVSKNDHLRRRKGLGEHFLIARKAISLKKVDEFVKNILKECAMTMAERDALSIDLQVGDRVNLKLKKPIAIALHRRDGGNLVQFINHSLA